MNCFQKIIGGIIAVTKVLRKVLRSVDMCAAKNDALSRERLAVTMSPDSYARRKPKALYLSRNTQYNSILPVRSIQIDARKRTLTGYKKCWPLVPSYKRHISLRRRFVNPGSWKSQSEIAILPNLAPVMNGK